MDGEPQRDSGEPRMDGDRQRVPSESKAGGERQRGPGEPRMNGHRPLGLGDRSPSPEREAAERSGAQALSSLVRGAGDPPIVVRHLDHWFGEGEARKQALFDVNLTLERGKLTVLLGASGSGKTTLLTLMGCLRRVQEGSVTLLGTELAGAPESVLVACRRRLGFIFQAHNLHESLTAMQNVRMGLEVHGREATAAWREACAHLLTLLGLGERLDYRPANLSGGQKQRVAVARALVGNPEIVFADEPTAALDKDSALGVVRLLKGLGAERGTTTLMVTHDTKIMDLADRIVTLEDGRIVSDSRG